MSIVQPQTATPAVRDHSVGLMIFGVFQILLGCLCGLAGVMLVVVTMLGPTMAMAPQGEAMNAQMMIPGMVLYFLSGVAMIWLGIGSIRARRWAWTLTVVASWMWLAMGVVAFIGFVFVAGPMMSALIEQQGKTPPGAIMAIRIIGGAVTFCIYVLLPAVFLIFYHRASVLATCRRRDPHIRWTDRCPMPVLALSILLAFSAASMLSMPAYGCAMPLFGRYISGAVGAAVIVLITLALAYLAWGTYRLQMAAWWATLLLWIVWIANMVITFSQTDLIQMYEKMGMSVTQLEMMRKSGFVELASRWGPWMALVSGAVWLGYLLYIRRYFTGNVEGVSVVSRDE